MKRRLLSIWILLGFCWPLLASAVEQIRVLALFPNKAMVSVDGTNRLLRQGKPTPEGVLLISALKGRSASREEHLRVAELRWRGSDGEEHHIEARLEEHADGPLGRIPRRVRLSSDGWTGRALIEIELEVLEKLDASAFDPLTDL